MEIRVSYQEAREVAVKALDKAFNTHFISVAVENHGKDYIMVDADMYNRAKKLYDARMRYERGIDDNSGEWMQYCRQQYG